jgi:lysozyme
MRVSDKGVNFVAAWEGFRSCPYKDMVGVWTIGYGTTSASGRHVGPNTRCITKRTAREWLQDDLNGRYYPYIPRRGRMRQHEKDALASFAYNNGPAAVGDPSYSTLARRLKSKEGRRYKNRKRIYREELPRWKYAGGEVVLGLVKRRAAEVALACEADYSGRP